jgi:NAD(P)-dependent dehydrogenase (short-subunit alcohol dehydrogenase family)
MKDQVVLITGGASGIGAATASELLARGAIPVLLDCDRETLASTSASLNGALTVCLDVTDYEACAAAVAQTIAKYGRIDVVWANAGIASFGPLLHTDLDAFKRCFEVNVFGTLNIVRAALPSVVAQRGYVLTTASVSSFAHPPCVSSYAASKAAVEAMCNCWRIELAGHGVGVGVIYASWVQTPMVTEGDMHPAFVRLKSTMPPLLRRAIPAGTAAKTIVNCMALRKRRIWLPRWVGLLYALRSALSTRVAERQLVQAAPDMEKLFLETVVSSGVKASSVAPRELARTAGYVADGRVQNASGPGSQSTSS